MAATAAPLADILRPRTLEPLALTDVEVEVHRAGDVTYYACALPIRLLGDEIRPSEGAEFFLETLWDFHSVWKENQAKRP